MGGKGYIVGEILSIAIVLDGNVMANDLKQSKQNTIHSFDNQILLALAHKQFTCVYHIMIVYI